MQAGKVLVVGMLLKPHTCRCIHPTMCIMYRNLVAMWHVLAGEPQLLRMVLSHLLEVLSLSLPYQEKAKGQGRVTRVETTSPKAVSEHRTSGCFAMSLSQLLLRHMPLYAAVYVHYKSPKSSFQAAIKPF